MFETKSSLCDIAHYVKYSVSVVVAVVVVFFSCREEEWALGNNFMKFSDFPYSFKFPKILCVKSFDNSRENNDILARI